MGSSRQGSQSFVSKAKEPGLKTANQVEVAESNVPRLTAQQIDQLLKLLPPQSSSQSTGSLSHTEDTDEEIDYSFAGVAHFAGIAACLHAEHESMHWVIDTGATDHMTSMPPLYVKNQA